MHIKIAYDIAAKKERRSTPQPSSSMNATTSTASSSTTTTISQNISRVNSSLCLPSTSNTHIPGQVYILFFL